MGRDEAKIVMLFFFVPSHESSCIPQPNTNLLSPQKHVTIVTGYVTGHEGMSGPACNLSMWTS